MKVWISHCQGLTFLYNNRIWIFSSNNFYYFQFHIINSSEQKLHPRVSGDLSQCPSAFQALQKNPVTCKSLKVQHPWQMAHTNNVCQSLCSNLIAQKVCSRLAAQVTLPHVTLSSNTASQCVSISVSSSPPASLSLFCMPPLNYQHCCRCFSTFNQLRCQPCIRLYAPTPRKGAKYLIYYFCIVKCWYRIIYLTEFGNMNHMRSLQKKGPQEYSHQNQSHIQYLCFSFYPLNFKDCRDVYLLLDIPGTKQHFKIHLKNY